MNLDKEIPFETIEGYQYLVSFREFPTEQNKYKIPLIDISITLMSNNVENNTLKTLHQFVEIIAEYLKKNNVIIYYYCDTSPIKIRFNRASKFTPQEFRFNLFSKMFNDKKLNDYYLQEIIIKDIEKGNHYISLISNIKNRQKVELVKLEIENFNK